MPVLLQNDQTHTNTVDKKTIYTDILNRITQRCLYEEDMNTQIYLVHGSRSQMREKNSKKSTCVNLTLFSMQNKLRFLWVQIEL